MSKLTVKEMIERVGNELFGSEKGRAYFYSRQCNLLHSSIESAENFLADRKVQLEAAIESFNGSEIANAKLENLTEVIVNVKDDVEKRERALASLIELHDEIAEASWRPYKAGAAVDRTETQAKADALAALKRLS